MISDQELQKHVQDELRSDPELAYASNVRVNVSEGDVTLSGSVGSYFERWKAESAAKRVAGVRNVYVELKISLVDSMQRPDADLARIAETMLEWAVGIPSRRINVTVNDGWLTLSGTVEQQYQRESAEQAVRGLLGLRGISNAIAVKPVVPSSEIREDIEAALKRSALLDASLIRVDVKHGIVTLSGNVHSWAERDEAERIAWAAPGVSEVNDLILFDYAANYPD